MGGRSRGDEGLAQGLSYGTIQPLIGTAKPQIKNRTQIFLMHADQR